MPSPKAAMHAALNQNADVTAVVGAKVYPDSCPQDDGMNPIEEPYLIFQVTNDLRPKTLRATAGIRRVRFELAGFCATRQQAEALSTAIENLLDGKSQSTFGGLLVKSSIAEDGAVDEDESPRPGEELGSRTVRIYITWWV